MEKKLPIQEYDIDAVSRTEEDTTGDGKVDTVSFDVNGDGKADVIVMDFDGDGVPDAEVVYRIEDDSADRKEMELLEKMSEEETGEEEISQEEDPGEDAEEEAGEEDAEEEAVVVDCGSEEDGER